MLNSELFMSNLVEKIDTAIKWSFYALFFTIPLVMWPDTNELFEFNKMWVVFIITIFIGFLWFSKMIAEGQFRVRRTPLDIPLALFFISQVISTIISIDPHTSIWGYYSRFNGGLLSTIAYIFLYYAYATNLIPEQSDPEGKTVSYKMLLASLLSGLAVTLWGLPSHFGLDPTCLVFRGTLDSKCWTADFQPQIRIFSTLGQPNWMGTYVGALLPISLGFGIYNLKKNAKNMLQPTLYLGLAFLFYLALLYTRSQSSFLGVGLGLVIFFALLVFKNLGEIKTKIAENKLARYLAASILIVALTTFIIGTPIESLNKFTTLSGIGSMMATQKPATEKPKAAAGGLESTTDIRLGGSESSDIRLIVWRGALEIFKAHPIFGTGVETYAYAYYQVKPLAHNLTSEWDYLYNKAHNEYLNYLATSGIVGLATYLLIILVFFYKAFTILIKKKNEYEAIAAGIVGGFATILVSNFFGFSVVPMNLLLFTLPIIFFELVDTKDLKMSFALPKGEVGKVTLGMGKMTVIAILAIIAIYYEFYLANFWFADRQYALGYNLDKAGQFSQAFTPLNNAVKMLPSEDLYKDELSINLGTLAVLLAQNNRATEAAQFAQSAKQISDGVIAAHPNNVVYFKTRARVAYALAQLDARYIDLAITTVEQARKLAPTDAKLVYNEALFYNQKGDNQKMLQLLAEAMRLKPNYIDAYYARALLYMQDAKENPKSATQYNELARADLIYILNNIDPTNSSAKDLLKKIPR